MLYKQSSFQLKATTFTKEQLQAQLDLLSSQQILQIALAGRSNVGKSSLINALACRKQLAKTSRTPGKTRSINFYAVEPDAFMLVDLPGYGYARCSQKERQKWAMLIEHYLNTSDTIKAFILLLDCRITPQTLDYELARLVTRYTIPLIPVLTKVDKCKQVEQSRRQKEWTQLLHGVQPVLVSSKKMKGIQEMWEYIQNIVVSNNNNNNKSIIGE